MKKMIEPRTLKGFRDFLPKEARKRQYVIDTLRKVFESYGFEPLETPALEYAEILEEKYGEEGERLMYKFVDKGGRKVALRYDQTVPLARVVAQYSNSIPLPFKRYQISNVWRGENPQAGRFREFLQCDIDTVGTSSLLADAEIIACALESIRKLGFNNLCMNINDRDVFVGIETKYMTIIDKLPKIGREAVKKELMRSMSEEDAESILGDLLKQSKTTRLKSIFELLESLGFKENKDFKFDQTIVRGLDYYTGVIFELLDNNSSTLSLGGGGRYDNLIGMFSSKTVPAVGFSFGFDRLIEAMEEQNLFPAELTTTRVLVIVFSKELFEKSFKAASTLRGKGINTELYLEADVKIEKQLKYADQKNIPYVVLIGPKEAESNSATVKNMKTGEQKTVKLEDMAKMVK